MIANILLSNPLCSANQSATQNLHTSTIHISAINTPADTPDLSTGSTINEDRSRKN
jgi:hypothetical protein